MVMDLTANLLRGGRWGMENLPVPDGLIRAGIRMICDRRLKEMASTAGDVEAAFLEEIKRHAVAEHADSANEQHYELPPAFFEAVLGPHLKYSCCYYEDETATLAEAEKAALVRSAANAGVQDGQDILELGCGWGSLTLHLATTLPNARITAVSNSAPQRQFIEARAAERNLSNVRIITADMNVFRPEEHGVGPQFDRIVSVEMFEHMSNWHVLLERVRGWVRPEGRFFMHIFTHENHPSRYDHTDPDDWMAQHFFTGGIMPSHGLIRRFNHLFTVEEEWRWNGAHYARTARDWLNNMDAAKPQVMAVLRNAYGDQAKLWERRWRVFFLAVEGMFGHRNGEPWGVSHYRLAPVAS